MTRRDYTGEAMNLLRDMLDAEDPGAAQTARLSAETLLTDYGRDTEARAPDAEALAEALRGATDKLEKALIGAGSDPEFAAIAVEPYRAALSDYTGGLILAAKGLTDPSEGEGSIDAETRDAVQRIKPERAALLQILAAVGFAIKREKRGKTPFYVLEICAGGGWKNTYAIRQDELSVQWAWSILEADGFNFNADLNARMSVAFFEVMRGRGYTTFDPAESEGEGWRSIETAPGGDGERGPVVLVYGPQIGVQLGHFYRFSDGEVDTHIIGFHGDWGVTHWRPLPAVPSDGGKA